MKINSILKKKVGTVILLSVATLSFPNLAYALNNSISNQNFDSSFSSQSAVGQTFINDPNGTGTLIGLNDWTYGFATSTPSNATLTLRIYRGVDDGGTFIGSSNSSTAVTFANQPSVQWNFTGLTLQDNVTYFASLDGGYTNLLLDLSDNYPNGFENFSSNRNVVGTSADLFFRGNFSAVPFEFSPIFGVVTLGVLALGRNQLRRFRKPARK